MPIARELGERVRISIRDPNEYAKGAAEALHGKTGTITELGDMIRRTPYNGVLVTFDTPADPWWTWQEPVKAFFFEPHDLETAETAESIESAT